MKKPTHMTPSASTLRLVESCAVWVPVLRRLRGPQRLRRVRSRQSRSSVRFADVAMPALIDARDDRQAWPQRAKFGGVVLQDDPHRYALHDLGEIAGRILGRDHAELRAGRWRKACDMAAEAGAGQHVGGDLHRLSDRHVRKLTLLEIGVDPKAVRRNDRQELRADGGVRAGAGAAVADHAVDRRADFGVAEIERRQVVLGLRLRQRGFDLPLFAVDHVELTLRRLERSLRLAFGGDRFLVVSVGLFETLDGGKAVGAQRAIAVEVSYWLRVTSAVAAAISADVCSTTAPCSRRAASRLASAASCAATFASARANWAR
jgi:hypothetical protein